MEPNPKLILNLSYIFPGEGNDYVVSYENGTGIPIPELGDIVGCKAGGYKVTSRVFNYDANQSLTIDITCG